MIAVCCHIDEWVRDREKDRDAEEPTPAKSLRPQRYWDMDPEDIRRLRQESRIGSGKRARRSWCNPVLFNISFFFAPFDVFPLSIVLPPNTNERWALLKRRKKMRFSTRPKWRKVSWREVSWRKVPWRLPDFCHGHVFFFFLPFARWLSFGTE